MLKNKMLVWLVILFLFSGLLMVFIPGVGAVAPSVDTVAATDVATTSAVIRGNLTDDGGENCSVWFEYGETDSYGSSIYIDKGDRINLTEDTFSSVGDALDEGSLANMHDGDWDTYGGYYQTTESKSGDFYFNYTNVILDDNISFNVKGYTWASTEPGIQGEWAKFRAYAYNFTSDDYEQLVEHKDYQGGTSFNESLELSSHHYSNGDVKMKVWLYANTGPNDHDVKSRLYECTLTSSTGVSTGETFNAEITGLSPGTTYHFRACAENSDGRTNGSNMNFSIIGSPTNITASFNSTSQNLTLSWSKTTGASHTLIRKSLTGYPTTITSGTLVGNVTGTTVVDASIDAAYYYSFWAFNDTYSYYSSTYSTLSWDDLNLYSINVYDEETEAAITNWSVLISSKDGTDTYYSSGNNNTLFLNVSDIPTGEDISFMFSATGYNTRTYTTDVTGIVNFNIYLIAESPPGAGDCSLLTFYDTRTVSNHSVVCTVNLTHTSESLISVEIYNTTLFSTYGGWIVVSSDYYTESVSQVVVSASILDANSSMVRVSYYYEYCVGDVSSLLYMVNVVDETSRPIKDAYISVTRYMSGTSSFEETASLYTDGNGQATLYLAPDVLYKFNISKTNYVTEVADWIPSEDVRSKTFTISPEPPDYTDEINIGDCFTFSGETNTTHAFVNFTCSCDTLYNFSIWIYEIEHDSGNISYFSSYNYTGDTSAAISFVMNLSCNYHISFYLNHSVFGGFWSSFYITNYEPPTSVDEFDDLFTNIFGDNSLTWSGLFGIFVLLAGLFAFGQRGAGISLVMVGFVMLGFNVVFGLLLLNVTICILIVLFGVLVQWKIERRSR